MKLCPLVNTMGTLSECGGGPLYLAPGSLYREA